MHTDTLRSDTLYVQTDPNTSSSFAEECSFGSWSRNHTTTKNAASARAAYLTQCLGGIEVDGDWEE